jgi:hypothetical protein
VRTTALPTSSDRASSNARRIVDARSFAVGMVVSEIRPGARVFALKAAKVATVRRREQGLLPSELSRQTKENPNKGADLERGKFGGRPMKHSARPRAPLRHTTTGCSAPISRSRDVVPTPEQLSYRQAAIALGCCRQATCGEPDRKRSFGSAANDPHRIVFGSPSEPPRLLPKPGRSARAHDQANARAEDRGLCLGASGR